MTMHTAEAKHSAALSQALALLARSLLLTAILFYPTVPAYADDLQPAASIRKSIFALDSARKTALQEFENPALAHGEKADYKDFIIFLNTRIINYCTELAEQEGTTALQELPCPGTAMTGTRTTSQPSNGEIFYTTSLEESTAQTQAEKTGQLEGDFLSALGEFDEMLLKEEERVAARVPSQRETGNAGRPGASGATGTADKAGAGEDSTTSETGDGVSSGAEGQAGSTSTVQHKTGPDSAGGRGDASVKPSVYGAPGGKLPPPEDDDIVARQLREAAEKEPDPELQKKLWEEYWKYKGVSKKGK